MMLRTMRGGAQSGRASSDGACWALIRATGHRRHRWPDVSQAMPQAEQVQKGLGHGPQAGTGRLTCNAGIMWHVHLLDPRPKAVGLDEYLGVNERALGFDLDPSNQLGAVNLDPVNVIELQAEEPVHEFAVGRRGNPAQRRISAVTPDAVDNVVVVQVRQALAQVFTSKLPVGRDDDNKIALRGSIPGLQRLAETQVG